MDSKFFYRLDNDTVRRCIKKYLIQHVHVQYMPNDDIFPRRCFIEKKVIIYEL